MLRHTKTMIVGAAAAFVAVAGALPAAAQTDDQSRLDAAIDAFEQRMTDAGWVGEPADEDDADDVADEDEDDSALGDDEFNACFGELATLFENVDNDEFPGQTALRESLEFTYSPEGEAPETTEEFSFELDAEETIAAFAVSVDDTRMDLLDSFVDTIGDKATGECMREAMEAEMTADTSSEEMLGDLEFAVENEADLGIGDRSARLQFNLDTMFLGMSLAFDFNMYLARVDHDLVMVVHGTFGEVETMSGLDPLAELETLADSL